MGGTRFVRSSVPVVINASSPPCDCVHVGFGLLLPCHGDRYTTPANRTLLLLHIAERAVLIVDRKFLSSMKVWNFHIIQNIKKDESGNNRSRRWQTTNPLESRIIFRVSWRFARGGGGNKKSDWLSELWETGTSPPGTGEANLNSNGSGDEGWRLDCTQMWLWRCRRCFYG